MHRYSQSSIGVCLIEGNRSNRNPRYNSFVHAVGADVDREASGRDIPSLRLGSNKLVFHPVDSS